MVSLCQEHIRAILPEWLLAELAFLQRQQRQPLYLAGGTVRDLLLDKQPEDIDLTVSHSAVLWAKQLAKRVKGAFVPLGRENDAARVVYKGVTVDFSSFREGAQNIEEELLLRDITINSMGICLDPLFSSSVEQGAGAITVIDPAGGWADLSGKRIKNTFSSAFQHDPLRLLRVYRFSALTGFQVDPETAARVGLEAHLIHKVAKERIGHELELIMASNGAGPIFSEMALTNLLAELLPELIEGRGMEQPASHHLDVFHHCLETLSRMEGLLAEPDYGFAAGFHSLHDYVNKSGNEVGLKWAALLHDIGKPVTHFVDPLRDNKITFYNHDHAGAALVEKIAARFRWGTTVLDQVKTIVEAHMRPFHLANVARKEQVSVKACIRLIKKMGQYLPGLFLLAMADARAGRGEGRPLEVEKELSELYVRLETVRANNVIPVLQEGALLRGKDLIKQLQLQPGPIFKVILEQVQEAQMEKKIVTQEQALEMAREIIAAKNKKNDQEQKEQV